MENRKWWIIIYNNPVITNKEWEQRNQEEGYYNRELEKGR